MGKGNTSKSSYNRSGLAMNRNTNSVSNNDIIDDLAMYKNKGTTYKEPVDDISMYKTNKSSSSNNDIIDDLAMANKSKSNSGKGKIKGYSGSSKNAPLRMGRIEDIALKRKREGIYELTDETFDSPTESITLNENLDTPTDTIVFNDDDDIPTDTIMFDENNNSSNDQVTEIPIIE